MVDEEAGGGGGGVKCHGRALNILCRRHAVWTSGLHIFPVLPDPIGMGSADCGWHSWSGSLSTFH